MDLLLAGALLWLLGLAFGLWWRSRYPERRDLVKDVLALGALALICAGFFWRLLFSGGVWVPTGGGDFASFYYPLYAFGTSTLRAGQIPLWNPFLYSGMPFAADVQTAVFYPVNLVFFRLLGGFDYRALELSVVLHYFIAAAGVYLLAITLGTSRLGAIVGAVVFAFSGFMVSHLGHLPMVAVAAWLPYLLLTAHQAFARRSFIWAAAAGLVLAVAVLAGHAQISLYLLLTVVLYWTYSVVRSTPKPEDTGPVAPSRLPFRERERVVAWHWLVSLGPLALILAVAAGASAIQLIPGYELSQLSVRSSISYEESTAFSVQPIGLAALFLPHLFGTNPTNYWGYWMSTEVLGYAGILSLILAALGVLFRRQRVAFFAVLAVAGLFLSLGGHTILHGWFYQFAPGFGKMRSTGRFLLLFNFSIAVLAAFGAHGLLEAARLPRLPRPGRDKTIKYLGLAAASATFLLVIVVIPVLFGLLLSHLDPLPTLVSAIEGFAVATVILLLASAVLLAVAKGWLSRGTAFFFILLIVVVDLFSAWSGFNVTTEDPTANFRHDQALEIIRQDQSYFRIDSDTGAIDLWQPSLGAVEHLPDVSGLYNPLRLQRYNEFWEIAKRNRSSRIYDFLNVKYVVAPMDLSLDPEKFELLYEDERGYRLFKNTAVLPRAMIVYNSAALAEDGEVLGRLGNPAFDPRRKVLLVGEGARALRQEPGQGEVTVTRYENERIDLEAQTDRPGYLVLSEVYYPGWEVRVDGQEVDILRANHAFRAVYLEAGTHSVTMVYRPSSWAVGAWISSVTWVAVIVFMIALRARFLFRNRKEQGA